MKSLQAILVAGLLAIAACSKPMLPPAALNPSPTPVVLSADPDLFEVEPTPIPTATPVIVTVRPAISPSPTPAPTAAPVKPLVELPQGPELTSRGLTLIYEFEVGGRKQYERKPYPELPDLRLSGVTVGIGYDLHQYSKAVILHDWTGPLAAPFPARLAATQPFYGRTAVDPLKQVRDILVPWGAAEHVFLSNDVAREFAGARRAFGPAFDDITKNCQAALIANGFARGYSTLGANRAELREIKALIPKKDYAGIANQLRKQERVWRGTTIYNGLKARVNAEAKLAETPDK